MKGISMKVFLIVITILLILFIFCYIFSLYLFNETINNKKSHIKPFGSNKYHSVVDHTKEDEKWIANNSQEVVVKSFDNLKLHAYDINFKHNDYAILVHGYRGKSFDLARVAKMFESMNYNILLPDLRGHGKSDGDYIGMGYHDHFDLMTWIKYLNENYPQAKIILYGISMGASTVLMASGENPQNLKLTIADAGYESIWDELKYQLKGLFHLPIFPFLYLTSMITKIECNYSFHDGRTIDYVEKAKKPILYIHGDKDSFILVDNAKDMYKATKSPKELLIVPNAQHVASEAIDSKKYWGTISNFINKYGKM